MIDDSLKQTILKEYLVGGTSYRKIEKKYGVSRMTLGRWMAACQQQEEREKQALQQAAYSLLYYFTAGSVVNQQCLFGHSCYLYGQPVLYRVGPYYFQRFATIILHRQHFGVCSYPIFIHLPRAVV